MRPAMPLRGTILFACLTLAPVVGAAQSKKPVDPYDRDYRAYLEAARAMAAPSAEASIAWMAGLTRDPRASRANDLVTVQVIEAINASGSADTTLAKNSTASVAVPKLFGLETRAGRLDPNGVLALDAGTEFAGSGATARAGLLTATMTARVVEVLPNGDLVLEGVREVEINTDRQVIVLTGVVRPLDIDAFNVVPSTAIGQLRIRYFGQGLMKDNLKPGWLVRILNKIF